MQNIFSKMEARQKALAGGDEPYILSGIPPIPTIYEAVVPSTVTNKDGLPIKIKARTNK
ncbi:MAG: hypothetical protein FD143_1658 [Ignavibacteria bacterium]|nr:MAG: hypothetical protein FD143_1658 [Ignavibacteria bacterium]